ncbi:MAG: nuclear transport factor 2 family protein [Cruoricaptor ignavus]|nr:nuclear transport factor 2 family protein [Cruoricaptor ignavus]
MKIVVKLLLGLLFLNAQIACSQTNEKPLSKMKIENKNTDELQILELTRKLTQLMIEKNVQEINKIVDADFTLTHITGYVQSKAEWFNEIETENMKYYSYKEVKTSVKIEGDKATFVGQNLLDARIWGSRNTWRLQQTMSLEKRNGEWIILKSVATTF